MAKMELLCLHIHFVHRVVTSALQTAYIRVFILRHLLSYKAGTQISYAAQFSVQYQAVYVIP